MKFRLDKIHHLIRYFLVLSILAFVGYLKHWNDTICLLLVGPCLYLASGLKKIIVSYVWSVPSSLNVNLYGFLLPLTVLYFGLIGFQLKQLWNERGKIRIISLVFFIGFLLYIHYKSSQYLAGYFEAGS